MDSAEPALNPETSKDPRISFDRELEAFIMNGKDNAKLIWDTQQKAWFPMFQDDLIAQQQSVYDPVHMVVDEDKKRKRVKPVNSQPVIRMSESTVYVSKLPLDITMEEMEKFFTKCGLLLPDIDTGKSKIKIYTDEITGERKGDGTVTYFKPESVDLAILILHECEIRPGFPISVEKAKFTPKDSHTKHQTNGTDTHIDKPPTEKKTSKIRRRQLNAQIETLAKHLDWDDDAIDKQASKVARSVIIKHMFRPAEFDADPALILDLKEEIREECARLGEVTTVTVFDKNPEGVVLVRFMEEASAKACVKMMDGRFFDKRKLIASIYDGVTKYSVAAGEEDEAAEKARMDKYEEWLVNGGNVDESKGVDESKIEIAAANNVKSDSASSGFLFNSSGSVRDKRKLIDEKDRESEEDDAYFEEEDDTPIVKKQKT